MKAVFAQVGDAIDYTPSGAVSAGDVVVIGSLVGIAKEDIAANAIGALAVRGIYNVVQAADTFAAGQAVYWDADGNPVGGTAGSGCATETATDNKFMGYALAATEATDTTVKVLLRSWDDSAPGMVNFAGKSIAATGSTATNAAALSSGLNFVTAADNTKATVLPAAVENGVVIVFNTVANKTLPVFPASSATINAGQAGAALTMAAGTAALFAAKSGGSSGAWYSLPLLPS